ncbi:hypothetical protein GGS23DRAFT_371404 [Durotheca rogersii]|uniref:uncharacterized protein n=1 Tax=Durotheca rogersii TaxID=419775 RepID=UPI0022208AE7|nr:uncharacterized protein GGS23DRAFT_371404 [Durotheca rogersii]KAI5866151.1 hypothetical protein GGS23DRAFT_371404 [Durotheca rogersii]
MLCSKVYLVASWLACAFAMPLANGETSTVAAHPGDGLPSLNALGADDNKKRETANVGPLDEIYVYKLARSGNSAAAPDNLAREDTQTFDNDIYSYKLARSLKEGGQE